MKYLVSSLLICFSLVACSGSPSKEEIAEIKEKLADGYYKRKAEEMNVDFIQY